MTDARLRVTIDGSVARSGAGEVNRSIDSIYNRAALFERQFGNSIKGATSSVAMLGTALSGLGVGVSFTQMVKDFAAFEKALVGVGKTTDMQGVALDNFGARITALSKNMPVTAEKLLEISQAAGALGARGEEGIARFTEVIAKMGTATDLAGEEAATKLSELFTVTRGSLDDAEKLASVIVALGNNMGTTESRITRAASEIGKATGIFNVSAGEAAAFGSVMAKVGVQVELGGSVMGRAMRMIDAETRKGAEHMKTLEKVVGMSGAEFRKVFEQDSVKAFNVFLGGLAKINASGGSVAAYLDELKIGGEETNKVLPTLALNLDLVNKALGIQKKEFQEGTALQKEYEQFVGTLSAQLDILSNTLKAASVAFGAELAPEVRKASDALREMLNSGEIASFAKDAGAAVRTLAENLDLITAAAVAYGAVKLGPMLLGAASAMGVKLAAVQMLYAAETQRVASAQAVAAAEERAAAVALVAAREQHALAASMYATAEAERVAAVSAVQAAKGTEAHAAALHTATLAAREASAAKIVLAAETTALSAATARDTAARAANTAIITQNTAASGLAAVAARGMAGALALIGGPGGAALLAGYAVYLLAQRTDELTEAQERHDKAAEDAKRITKELETASKERAVALEAERRHLISKAEAELQAAQAAVQAARAGAEAEIWSAGPGAGDAVGMVDARITRLAELEKAASRSLTMLQAQSGAFSDGARGQGKAPSWAIVPATKAALPAASDEAVPGGGGKTKKAADDYAQLRDRLLEVRDTYNQGEASALRFRMEHEKLADGQPKYTQAQINEAVSIQQQIDAREELKDALKEEQEERKRLDDQRKRDKKAVEDEAISLRERVDPLFALDRKKAELDLLRDTRPDLIDDKTYSAALKDISKDYDDIIKKENEANDVAKDLGLTFTSAFEDAVVGGKNARDVMAGLVDDMARLALRKSLIEPGANFASGLFTKGIGLAANFFLGGAGGTASTPVVNGGMSTPVGASPFANGGIMSEHGPVSLRKYANGGIANTPQLALYGEGSRPEAYVPLPDGRSIPVTMTGGGGGAVIQNTVNVSVQGGSANSQQGFDPETARAIDRQIKAMLDSNTADWMRKQSKPGGVINPLTA